METAGTGPFSRWSLAGRFPDPAAKSLKLPLKGGEKRDKVGLPGLPPPC